MGELLAFLHKCVGGLAWIIRGLKWWVWIAAFFIGLVWICLYQRGEIKAKNTALMQASFQLSNAAFAIRTRDSLIFSITQTSGQQWTDEEEWCRAQINNAYAAGVSSGGVRNNRERQAAGAFAGSVSGEEPSDSSR